MTHPCNKCGHPHVYRSKSRPSPDPLKGMTANCAICKRSVVYDDHHWETKTPEGKKYVCCSCYAVTAPLTNHPLAMRDRDQADHQRDKR